MSQAPLLQPLAFPLRGNALIEASAGTGKTFTIAALYLRLVLGHGGENAFGAPLVPPQILVVTFTDAATKELRDRIRARLAEAAEAFRQDPAEVVARKPGEDLLHDLRASYPPAQWRACARRLQLAAEWMDEAAVSTIHAWCNRMLREHAFDSGSLFTQALVTSQEELEQEAVRDYWRSFFYPLADGEARAVRDWWPALAGFESEVRALLKHAERLPAQDTPADVLAQARVERARQLAELKAPWAAWADELEQLVLAACDAGRINLKACNRGHWRGWLEKMRAWASSDVDWPMEAEGKGWLRLTPAGLREVWLEGDPFAHAALEAMESLRDQLAALPDGRDAVLAHAARWVAERVGAALQRRAQMGFDDLLRQLHAALHGPNGARLAELIRGQFPVALIDEFQDTDPVQYGIFRRVYCDPQATQSTALVLIGDPKQAIYAFRGADIHTYLQARRDTEGRHYTLGTNYRSTEAMVQAVNHLFGRAENAPGPGAFRFRSDAADPLPFHPVQARGQGRRWVVEDAPAPALTCWWPASPEVLQAEGYKGLMAAACAAEIVRLLNLGARGRAGFAGKDQDLQPLRPRDIAVLVNGRSEAEAIQAALRAGGVRSVYLSDRDSVYETPAAAELQRLLQACAAPDDPTLLRAGLATPLLALSWQQLEALNQDEVLWDTRLQQFRGYLQQWRAQGVLPMVRALLHDFGVPGRLLAAQDERTLTDLLHLAELLQHASGLVQGEHALVRYLAQEREGGAANGDQRQVRLESDADLLKVVTVHKSKGLEYPLVFLPFACTCRPVSAKSVPFRWHDEQGEAHVALRAEAQALARAEEARLGEDLRKLYVALTRAVHATWIGIAPVKELGQTALGALLQADGDYARAQLEEALRGHATLAEAAPVEPGRFTPAGDALALQGEARVAHAQREPWWIASYSRLLGTPGGDVVRAAESAEEANYEEEPQAAGAPVAETPAGTLHAFPRGAAAGTFLHGVLEWAGRHGFAAAAEDPDAIAAMLARRCVTPAWQAQQPVLRDWLAQWLVTPWPLERLAPGAAPVAPAQLASYQVEMEFWFSASTVDVRRLDALVTRHTLGGAERPALGLAQMNGMLKGFMDLVFEHEGRYYVADYKSNHLGPQDRHYTLAAMRDEVLAKRYDLQYSLYLFALHRLLQARLPDYDYERHVGGAVYIFLRGHAHAPTQGLHLERPPLALMEALDALFRAREVDA